MQEPAWNLASKIVFRFLCAYWVLYCLPAKGNAIVRWVAVHVFHLSGPAVVYRQTGSGDTTLDYVHTFCVLVVAAAVAAVWSMIDRKRGDYRTLHLWLRLLVRYTLAITLFSYGFQKVFPLQFPFPPLNRLIEPFGDFSPMGILWNFMGSSPAYVMFSGAAEVTGGLLLVFARTTALGAIVSAAVMLNVVVLNFCYDVPVKLYSLHLFLMAVFLLAPDLRKLFGFLVMGRGATPPAASSPVFEQRGMRIAALVLKIAVIGFFVGGDIVQGYFSYQAAVVHPDRPVLYGVYSVESFVRNDREVPPLATDGTRWKTMLAPFPAFIQVEMMDGSVSRFRVTYNPSLETVTLTPGQDTLTYSRPDADHVLLKGKLGADMLTIGMRRRDPSAFLLVNRGFHWINEVPFNR